MVKWGKIKAFTVSAPRYRILNPDGNTVILIYR